VRRSIVNATGSKDEDEAMRAKIFEALKGILEKHVKEESTIRVGHPDFTIFENGRIVFIGMKKAHTQPSADQICCMDMLRDRGFTTVIARSDVEAIELTKDFLGI
jgi:hypothetical protein